MFLYDSFSGYNVNLRWFDKITVFGIKCYLEENEFFSIVIGVLHQGFDLHKTGLYLVPAHVSMLNQHCFISI